MNQEPETKHPWYSFRRGWFWLALVCLMVTLSDLLAVLVAELRSH